MSASTLKAMLRSYRQRVESIRARYGRDPGRWPAQVRDQFDRRQTRCKQMQRRVDRLEGRRA